MAQTRLKSGNLHMVGGDNGSSGNVLKSKGDGTMEWGVVIINPTFSSFDYPGDDTALDPAGGQSLVINGSDFSSGVTVTIDGTTPSSITLNSSSQLTVTTPAKSAGAKALVITNTDGGTASTNVSYNGIPAFTNAAGSLASVKSGATINVSAAATEPDGGAITYAITSGALPSGVSLNTSTGAITGTAPDVSASTTSNFTVTATDNENQSTARAYSITVTPPLPSDNFKAVTYTGNGGTQSINVGFKPDFVWIKQRNATNHSRLLDSTRGATKILYSSLDYAEDTESTGLTAFTSTGFNLGAQQSVNDNNDTYVAWCWKANGGTTSSNSDGAVTTTVQVNNTLGFSIVSFSGTGSETTFGHGLGEKPDVVIIKKLDGTDSWNVYHDLVDGSMDLMYLNLQAANSNSSRPLFTNSLFYWVNSGNYIAYCFKSADSFSKIDVYTGNGSADGPIVETGFEPAFLMIKRNGSSDNWYIVDNKRSTSNPRQAALFANLADGEYPTYGAKVDFLSNGFEILSTDGAINGNNDTYMYMAFAEDPDTTSPTLADSFGIETYTGNGGTKNVTGLGFKPGLVWLKNRAGTTYHNLTDIVRGVGKQISSVSSSAEEYNGEFLQSFDNDGFTLGGANGYNNNGVNFVSWNWKADDNEPTILQDTEDAPAVVVYKFEDNANDVSTNYNGTASNMSYATGKFNKAGIFNGSSSYIDTNYTMPASSKYSFSFWFNTTYTGSYSTFFSDHPSNGAGAQARVMAAIYNGSKFQINIANGSSQWSDQTTVSATPYLDGNWHHYAMTVDGNTVKLYINGRLLNTYTSSITAGTAGARSISIGRLGDYNGEYFPGKLDQFRIYNKTLNQASVTKLYNETTAQNGTLNIGTKGITSDQAIGSTNSNAGFSIVKYKGSGVSGTIIPHGLSATPNMTLIKCTSNASTNWIVHHSSLGNSKYLTLNSDAVQDTSTNWLVPSATTFALNNAFGNANTSGRKYVAYCFHDVTGYSKFGSYTGATAGVTITTGFQPDFVMIKSASNVEHWAILDSTRGSQKVLYPNRDTAESNTALHTITFSSTGFSFPHQDTADAMLNENGYTYIYAAFKIN